MTVDSSNSGVTLFLAAFQSMLLLIVLLALVFLVVDGRPERTQIVSTREVDYERHVVSHDRSQTVPQPMRVSDEPTDHAP